MVERTQMPTGDKVNLPKIAVVDVGVPCSGLLHLPPQAETPTISKKSIRK